MHAHHACSQASWIIVTCRWQHSVWHQSSIMCMTLSVCLSLPPPLTLSARAFVHACVRECACVRPRVCGCVCVCARVCVPLSLPLIRCIIIRYMCDNVTAQGRLLRLLGVPWALAASPLIAAVVFAAVAAHPSLTMVTCAEILRKVSCLPWCSSLVAWEHGRSGP